MAKPQMVKSGDCVAVCLWPDSAPENCYVGLVEAVDEYGIRLNLVHWDDKLDMLGGYTLSIFLPWENISSMLINATEQPTRRFMTNIAPNWHSKVEAIRETEESKKKKQNTKE